MGATETSSVATAPAKPRRLWRRLAWSLAGLLLVLVGSLAALWWGLGYPATLPWLLAQVPGLKVSGVEGSLLQGPVRIGELSWQAPDDAGHLSMKGLSLNDWTVRRQPYEGAWAGLRIDSLKIAELVWTSGKPSTELAKPPTTLRLPVQLAVDQLQIDRLQVDKQAPLLGLMAKLSLGDARGSQHLLNLKALQVELGDAQKPAPVALSGELKLGSDAPLPLTAKVSAQGRHGRPWQAELQAKGPLQRLDVGVALQVLASQATAGPADATKTTKTAKTTRPSSKTAAAMLDARAEIKAFEAWPLGTLSLNTRQLNLQDLAPGLPHTAITGQAELQTKGADQPMRALITLDNAHPGRWDTGQLPLRRLNLQATGKLNQTDRLVLEQFELQLADGPTSAGRIKGQGRWQGAELNLALDIADLRPEHLHASAAPMVLGGPLKVQLQGLADGQTPSVTLQGQLNGRSLDSLGLPVQLQLAGQASANRIQLTQFDASAGAATAKLTLDLQPSANGWQAKATAKLAEFDPLPWWRGGPGSLWRRGPHRLQGQLGLDLTGKMSLQQTAELAGKSPEKLLSQITGSLKLDLANSLLAGLPASAQFDWLGQGPQFRAQAQAELAGNRVNLSGQAPSAAPRSGPWQLNIAAPQLAALQPLRTLVGELVNGVDTAWPKSGAVTGQAQVSGVGPGLSTQGELKVSQLVLTDVQIEQVQASWQVDAGKDPRLKGEVRVQGVKSGAQRLDLVSAKLSGTASKHRLQLLLDSPVRPPAWTENLLGPAGTGTRMQLLAEGQWQPAAGTGGTRSISGVASAVQRYLVDAGRLSLGARDAAGGSRPWLSAQDLRAQLSLDAGGALQSVNLPPGRLQLAGTTALRWQTLKWDAAKGAQSDKLSLVGELERFDVAQLLAKLQPDMGWRGNLSLGGQINVQAGERFDADVVLQRMGGDLLLSDDLAGQQALGLSDLRLALTAHDGLWQFAQGLAGTTIGTISGAQVITTTPDRRFPHAQAKLQGVLQARVANLGVWGTWVPPGWRLGGALDTEGLIGGTLAAPELRGSMRGRGLAVRHVLQGINLTDGELAVVLEGETARIERFVFKGGDGQLSLTGGANLGDKPSAQLSVVADKFKVLGRLDRRLVASGKAELLLDKQRLKLDGQLVIDEGLIDVSRGEAPTLDSDVVVRRAPLPTTMAVSVPSSREPPAAVKNAQVAVSIDLGENLRLNGLGVNTSLRGKLQVTAPGGQLRVNGAVRTHGGKFAAYGQKLEITRGVFTFSGPVDTPRLDILAIRPNLDENVGVTIDGPSTNPRVRLYSQNDMADYDKLSWLMLGRGPDGLGNADTALLQRAAMAVLSGDKPSATDKLLQSIGLTDFSVRQGDGGGDTFVSLGKQLSDRLYVGYERGVNATTGSWQLIYRVAQRFTLRGQTGEDTAVDVIWSWRW